MLSINNVFDCSESIYYSMICTPLSSSSEYVTIESLGEGFFCEKWLLMHRETGNQYAIKMYKDIENVNDAEIDILKSLRHPHVLRNIESTIIETRKCFLMEFCRGISLSAYLQNQRDNVTWVSEEQVWNWTTQIADALEYCHHRNVIHRDLKPSNVFVIGSRLKVGDFGLARMMDMAVSMAITREGSVTFQYFAPELFVDLPQFEAQADIWALGCIVFEMCALKRLFNEVEEIVDVNYDPPRIPLRYSEELWTVVKRMLHKHTRPTSTEIRELGKKMGNVFQITYEGLPAMLGNLSGNYPPFSWQENNLQWRWNEILLEENWLSEKLPLPPLMCLLNETSCDLVPIVIYGRRWRNEFWVFGAFHSKAPTNVSAVNVRLELSLSFTKKDNTSWTVDKQVIATVEHGTGWLFEKRICTLYDVPFACFSPSSAPVATKVSIRRVSTDLTWCYWGLSPQFSRDGEFTAIDCNLIHGTFDCAREWKKMLSCNALPCGPLEDLYCRAFLSLPPLLLTCDILKDVAVCVFGWRDKSKLSFHAKLHPSAPANVTSHDLCFKIDLHLTTHDYSIITRQSEVVVSLQRDWTNLMIFDDIPWSSLSASSPRFIIYIWQR